jgi:hypothetical protein
MLAGVVSRLASGGFTPRSSLNRPELSTATADRRYTMMDWRDPRTSAEEIVARAVLADELSDIAVCMAIMKKFKSPTNPYSTEPLLLLAPSQGDSSVHPTSVLVTATLATALEAVKFPAI